MKTLSEIEQAVVSLPLGQRRQLLDWIAGELEAQMCVAEPSARYGNAAEEREYFTLEEYFEIEEASSIRHEYVAGEIYAMAEPHQAHEIIAGKLFAALHAHLRGRPCRTYMGGRQLHFKCRGDDIVYYPDVWVGCGQTRNAKEEFVDEPRLVIEVLSPSTARVDRREKAINYREIPSLEECVLVAQKPVRVVIHRRAKRWAPVTLESVEAVLELQSVGLALSIGQVYEGLP